MKEKMAKHQLTTEIHIPLREVPDRDGGKYFIGKEMLTQDLAVNLPDFVIIILPGKDKRLPELVLRVRDDDDDNNAA